MEVKSMKINRMIGILSLLLQREKVTTPELAEHFEVSKRTIIRDIDALCQAGIPICTTQGTGGGIRIMDGYRMDRTVLTSKDMQMIMAGLRSLDSVSGSHYYSQLMEKIKAGSSNFIGGNDTILIDLSSWDKESISEKITLIQTAIDTKRAICFDYYSPKAESARLIDPYYLIFKWSSWYVWGFCRGKQDFRMFKLNRMDRLELSAEPIANREIRFPEFETKTFFPENVHLKAAFGKGEKRSPRTVAALRAKKSKADSAKMSTPRRFRRRSAEALHSFAEARAVKPNCPRRRYML